MSEAFIALPSFNQIQDTPRIEYINISGSFVRDTTIWYPASGTPFRVFITSAQLTGQFEYFFYPIDCRGTSITVEPVGENAITLTVSLTSISFHPVSTSSTRNYLVTGVAYYDA